MNEHPTSVRLSDDTLERVDRVAAQLTKQAAGLQVGRSRALQLTIAKGLDALEEELGMSKKPKRK
ncbi:MAG: hypothetical protein ACRENE_14860 [Polyangiaceae bacterium]